MINGPVLLFKDEPPPRKRNGNFHCGYISKPQPPMPPEDDIDVCSIRVMIRQSTKMPNDFLPPIQVTKVGSSPDSFRVNVFVKKNLGKYVSKSYFVEKVSPTEYVYTPNLKKEDLKNEV